MTPAKLAARRMTYRGREGFHVYGKDTRGRHISIHVRSRTAADAVKAAIKRGDNPDPHLD